MGDRKRRGSFRNISIAKKLYFIVGAMAILIITELLVLWFSIHTLSSVRAFIAAEGLWSKAQKDAVSQLGKYHRTQKEEDYDAFRKLLTVPLGDHKARMELSKGKPNLDTVREGFLEGRVHPDDIEGMIKLVTRFNKTSYISKAVGYWSQGDSLMAVFVPTAAEMHLQISSGGNSKEKLDQLNLQVGNLNEQLTHVEDNFSFTLGEGARWLENLILKILFSVALTVEITGLVFTVLVTRNITRGLNAINKATNRITKGHFDERATVFSNDEIGQVATSVNSMAEQLIISNRELENFAHIASHDLREPLRKIMIFTDLLKQESVDVVSEKAKLHMQKIKESALGMQLLIKDILQFAALSGVTEYKTIKLDHVITHVLSEMEVSIAGVNAKITVTAMPSIEANATQMHQLFQNLLSNALKFSEVDPVISISSEIIHKPDLPVSFLNKLEATENGAPDNFCKISVKDNGIGFDEIYADKIFTLFQRLHGKKEYEGTGIGLAICQKIVENHHGIIYSKSTPGQGSTFIITLPFFQKGLNNK